MSVEIKQVFTIRVGEEVIEINREQAEELFQSLKGALGKQDPIKEVDWGKVFPPQPVEPTPHIPWRDTRRDNEPYWKPDIWCYQGG